MDPAPLAWKLDSLGGGALSVRWLGTAGFALECEGQVVITDPYLSLPYLSLGIGTPPLFGEVHP